MSVPVFPSLPGITFPVKQSIKWSGNQQDALSGKRTRTSFMTYPTYAFEVTFNFLRSAATYAEWQQLAAFINSLAGGTGLFAYQNPNDYVATAQSFGQGDGVTQNFQLTRSLGGFVEPVFLPDLTAGLVTQVSVAGTPTTAYTVSATGVIQFTSAPANGAALAWTGTFKWPCRLDGDLFDFSNFMSQLFEMKVLKFSSEKLP